MDMKYLSVFAVFISSITLTKCLENCPVYCPDSDETMVCGLHVPTITYKMFSNLCAMNANSLCENVNYTRTAVKFCILSQGSTRRSAFSLESDEEETCPVFCPKYYRPVCGASRLRFYRYRSFTNRCHMDIISCRGDEETGYVEVPLSFCQRHAMKNIFREKLLITGNYAGDDDFNM